MIPGTFSNQGRLGALGAWDVEQGLKKPHMAGGPDCTSEILFRDSSSYILGLQKGPRRLPGQNDPTTWHLGPTRGGFQKSSSVRSPFFVGSRGPPFQMRYLGL